MSIISEIVREIIAEANIQKIGRKKLIRARVRGGKVQRRKVFSAVPYVQRLQLGKVLKCP